jgi:hypothetical protein
MGSAWLQKVLDAKFQLIGTFDDGEKQSGAQGGREVGGAAGG